MKRSKFIPAYFQAFPLHRAAANGHVMEVQRQLNEGANPYRPMEEGLTAMHAAVANNSDAVVDVLLKRYEEDWSVARDTIQHRFLWKPEQVGWKSRPILIAWTEAECVDTLALAASCPAGIPLNLQVFVLLRQPQQGHHFVALDVCNRSKRWNTLRLIRELLPNGVLSLDRSDLRVNTANYLHMACSYSKKGMIVKLIRKGASLTVHSGEQYSPPFVAACEGLRKDIVELLTNNYAGRFDPGACDKNDYNALHRMIQRGQTGMVDLIVQHMLKYRMTTHRETESQAINNIFRYDSEEYKYTNIWCFAQSVPMKELCSKYIRQGRIDLRSRLDHSTVLDTLLYRGIALDYCFKEIEENLDLLRMENDYTKVKVLHTLIRCKRLTFVQDLYAHHGPLMKEIFEQEDSEHKPAFELLRNLMHNTDEQGLLFVLEHHRDYYVRHIEILQNSTLRQNCANKPAFDRLCDIMTEAIPELKVVTEELKHSSESKDTAFFDVLRSLRESFNKTADRLKAKGERLEDYMDSSGRTFLHAAVEWSDKAVVEKLLARNFDVMKKDANGCLPIHLVRRSESLFEMLLAQNESEQLAYVNDAGYNLLHISCKNGLRGSALEKLLENGMDINGAAPDGNVPLSLASCCGTAWFLLKHGAQVELLREDLFRERFPTMQYCAVWELLPHIAHMEWFKNCAYLLLPWMVGSQNRDFFYCSNERQLEKHEDIRKILFDALYEHSKKDASELFSRVCHTAIVCCARWFLEYDYDLDYDYPYWRAVTPLVGLLSYMEMPNFDIVEKLLRKPINVNAVDERGRNALITLAGRFKWAKHYGHSLETVRLLLEHGSKLDEQDESGNTALHYAFEWEQWDLVEFLIEKGANANVKNASNKLPCETVPGFCRSLFGFIR